MSKKMKLFMELIFCTLTISFTEADVASDFVDNEIVPDALDKGPDRLLSIFYKEKALKFGEELTPTDTIKQPIIDWKFDSSALYVLIMTNLDPLNRQNPQYREFLHWLVVNVPGNDFSKGEIIVEYAPVGPPKDGGIHRILFTVYKQECLTNFTDLPFTHNRKLGIRLKFNQREFSKKYKLGDPLFGNVFTAQYDDFVPRLHSEFINGIRV